MKVSTGTRTPVGPEHHVWQHHARLLRLQIGIRCLRQPGKSLLCWYCNVLMCHSLDTQSRLISPSAMGEGVDRMNEVSDVFKEFEKGHTAPPLRFGQLHHKMRLNTKPWLRYRSEYPESHGTGAQFAHHCAISNDPMFGHSLYVNPRLASVHDRYNLLVNGCSQRMGTPCHCLLF